MTNVGAKLLLPVHPDDVLYAVPLRHVQKLDQMLSAVEDVTERDLSELKVGVRGIVQEMPALGPVPQLGGVEVTFTPTHTRVGETHGVRLMTPPRVGERVVLPDDTTWTVQWVTLDLTTTPPSYRAGLQ